ncbi:putative transport protein MmpL2 [Diplonema papillatum]|nr:putative transport protein MmpL2 [Diplonema papillatum]
MAHDDDFQEASGKGYLGGIGGSPVPLHLLGGFPRVASVYVRILDTPLKYAVLLLYVIATAVAFPWAIKMTGRTSLKWDPPTDSYAEEQQQEVSSLYPQKVGAMQSVVFIEFEDKDLSVDVTSIVSTEGVFQYPNEPINATIQGRGVQPFTQALQIMIMVDWCGVTGQDILILQAQIMNGLPVAGCPTITAFDAFFTVGVFEQLYGGPPLVANFFRAPEEQGYRNTIIAIQVQGTNLGLPDRDEEFVKWLDDALEVLNPQFLDNEDLEYSMQASAFSIQSAMDEIVDTVAMDLLLADGIAIPISLVLVCYVVRNFRFMLWPVVAILTTTVISMAIVAEIAVDRVLNVAATPLVISLGVGLPVGHAVFMLNRFREALLEGEDCASAVTRSFVTAGNTITTSQIGLAMCVLVTVFVDVENVKGLALAMLVTVLVSFFSAVLLGPALLLSFPNFFEAAAQRSKLLGAPRSRETVALASHLKGRGSQYDGRASFVPQISYELEETLWHRFASVTQVTTIQNLIIVVLIVMLTLPFAVVLHAHTYTTDSIEVYLPRRDDFTKTAARAFHSYGSGLAMQYQMAFRMPDATEQIVLNPADPAAVQWDTAAFQVTGNLTASVRHFVPEGGIGGNFAYGYPLDQAGQVSCSYWLATFPTTDPPPIDYVDAPSCYLRGILMAGYAKDLDLNPTPPPFEAYALATHITYKSNIDPLGVEGTEFMDDFREFQVRWNHLAVSAGPEGPVLPLVFMSSPAFNSQAAMDRSTDSWQWLVPSYFLIMFVVTAVSTLSAVVALRTLFTTGLTVWFSLGLTSATYCHGFFDWTNLSAISSFETADGGTASVHYLVFVVTLPLIMGLAMCHELFLVSTAQEWYHVHRLHSNEAIKMALVGVGWINIVSGFILAVSFMGHLFSRLPIINQISFALFWALVYDVIVIRTILVPTVMAPLGRYNWWPMRRRTGEAATHDGAAEYDVSMQPHRPSQDM